ncbi:hypothetical protein [Variovorax sp.]|uniref:hypothetical protein n=1 Tax=Variovorax sp. TaxID=1871043 RepID=UPI002D37A4D2|nr:hypothetical protein [Variovorax sp.]HYP84198.1 hypothetical protein [Variovorax sp.]
MPRTATNPPDESKARVPDPGTTRATKGPRLPHERDESSDSQHQDNVPGDKERRAHDDVERGVVDTDRGPVTDRLYREKLKR